MKYKILLLAVLFSSFSWGQSSIAAVSTNYTQNFDGLTSGGWVDGTTLTGWYAKTSAGTGINISAYGANTGTTLTAGLYGFGVAGTNALTDRSLGIVNSNTYTGTTGVAKGFYGWRLKNNTGSTLTSVTVTWTGEQWRKAAVATTQNLSLFYQTSASAIMNLSAGSWTAAPSTFTTPIASTATAIALDGNAPANRVAAISVTITVSIPAGNEIMLRWEDLNDTGNDHYVALDDVTVNASNATKVSASSGDWNTAATWTPVGVPAAGDNVVILAAHTVSTAIAITPRTGTTTVNGSFQLNTGGWASGVDFAYNATTGGLIFNTTYTANSGSYWPATNSPANVTVNTSCPLTLGFARTVSGIFQSFADVVNPGTLTINGTLLLNAGYSFSGTGSPIYGASSLLKYNSGGSPGRGAEWVAATGTIGATAGYPNNIQISGSTNLNFPNGSTSTFKANGSVIIDALSNLSQNFAGGSAALIVGTDITINGGLTLGGAAAGDITVGGNWTRASTATFTPNGRAVFFNGTTTQNLTITPSGTATFNFLVVQGSGTLKPATGTNFVVNASNGLTLSSSNATSTIDLNGQTLTLSGGGNLDLSAGARKITSTVTGGKVSITTADLTVTNGGSLSTDANTLIDLQKGLDCGTASLVTINGTLQINANGFCTVNSPRYGNTSLLQYNTGGTYNRQLEWTSTAAATGGVGAPNNVQVSNSTLLNYYNATNTGDKSIVGNLVVDLGSTFDMLLSGVTTGGAVTIPGNVTVAGTLKLGFASGDDLKTAGNLAFTGTGSLVGNNRAIFFTKNGTQQVSSVAALTIPYVVTAGSTGTTVQLLNDLIISSPLGSNAISFVNSADVIDINGLFASVKTLTIGSTGNAGVIAGGGSFKGSIYSNLTLLGTGNIGTIKFGPLAADMNLGTFVMNRTATGGCTMGSAVTINTALILTAGLIDLNNTIMTLAVGVNPTGIATSYIIADVSAGGVLRKNINATGSQTFPIGSGGTQYTPATINLTTATIAVGSYLGVAVENAKAPLFDATTHYINRYWDVTSSGITATPTAIAYTFVGTYINAAYPAFGDVSGTNITSRGNQWNGTAWLNNGNTTSVIIGPPATITAPALTLPATNRFTGGRRDQDINIKETATSVSYPSGNSAAPFDFGSGTIGTPIVKTFTIENLGQANLKLNAATLSGSVNYATNYATAVTTGPDFFVTPGLTTTTFTITFTPTVSGTITGSISIVNDDTYGSESPYVLYFTGVGNCPPNTVAATPTSGPAGTDVLINASVGNFTGTTSVNFNGIVGTFVLNSATQLLVTVPDGAVSGSINIVNGTTSCVTPTPFTVITKTGTCSGLNELIMTEIYDKTAGALGYIEVYNGTGASINLSTYKIRRFADNAALLSNNYQDFSFNGVPALATIANNTVKYGKISTDTDTATPDFGYTPSVGVGINGSDIFYLYNGTTVVDVFVVPTASAGYTERRKLTTLGPNTSSNPSDWTEIVSPGEVTTDLGLFPFTPPTNNIPAVNTDPVDLTTCNLTASFSVTATPSAGSLIYQWQYNSGLTTGWAPIAGGTFTGVTATGFASATLNLNGAIGTLTGYQFYCQVTQTGGCTVASDAAQLTVSTATWNGLAWTNGPPSLTKQVILTGSYNMATPLPSFEACSLYVNSPNVLTITSGNYVSVQNNITVVSTGNVLVKDDASLIQISDSGVNTGSVTVERITTAKLEDYVYWSSPVANFPITSISPSTSTSLIWKWNPAVNNSNNGQGRWEHPIFTPTPDNMAVGVGYIIKGLTGLNTTTFTDYLATFAGTPFNGVKQPGIARGDITTSAGIFPAAPYAGTNGAQITQFSDNMNLMGNPYPSAVNAIKFLTLNTNIDGNVRLWTHGSSPSASTSPYYGSYGYNYSPGDYITYNVSGSSIGPSAFGGNIASGQGFFVTMNDGLADATQTVTFNNGMRSNYSLITSTYSYYGNSNFYRNANAKTIIPQDIERHRIWLDLVSGDAAVSTRTLVGYIEGATMEKDRLFDAKTSVGNALNLYSLIDDKPYCIQGRALPFDSDDKVSLGVKLPISGSYTIAIATTDGLFNETNQAIYLEDTALNIIHDLRQAPYVFTGDSGRFEARFILRYKNTFALGTVDFENLTNSVVVTTPNHNQIGIKSYNENMKSVIVYDILGRVVYNNNQVNAKELTILNGVLNQQTLIVKTTLENGLVVTKKIVL